MRIAAIGNVTVHTLMKICKDSLHIVNVKIAFITKIRAKKQITRTKHRPQIFLAPPFDGQVEIQI